MDRTLSPVFLQARDAIESVLSKYGFRVTKESLYYSAFGSTEVEYCHRAHWLRLSWAGTCGLLVRSPSISMSILPRLHGGRLIRHPLQIVLLSSSNQVSSLTRAFPSCLRKLSYSVHRRPPSNKRLKLAARVD